ncbi:MULTISPECIES: aldehyde dehydrogenase family protein [unclassified Streptomyces]|uniref:aldehyde dehydrogenase family protein n=1 Tax=unclassified Streptomyces TaxID=2593676 RepID=UPI00336AD35A
MRDHPMYRREFFIGGEWAKPTGTSVLKVVSPSTEEAVGEVPVSTTEDMDRAVAAARAAFDNGPWPRMTPDERADVLARAAELFRLRNAEIADVLVDEMGVASSQAPLQTGTVAPVFDYYAELIRSFEFDRVVRSGDRVGLVVSDPVGVVGAIVPWNAPVTLAAWKVAPALAAGCTVVLKPPPEAPLSNYILAEVLHEAGVPAGVVNVVPGDREVGEHVVTHPGTDKIAFTGSTAAGMRIMSLCGDRVKRVSLELGGKSAALVLDDADVPAVTASLFRAGMHNSGQVCAAVTRVLVPRSRYAQALESVADGVEHPRRRPARPFDRGRPARRRAAARPLGGLHRPRGRGGLPDRGRRWPPGPPAQGVVRRAHRPRRRRQLHAVAQEEIFGPVVCVIPHDGDDDAVRIANDTRYGLSGSVWTGDPARGLALARRLRTGGTVVNGAIPPQPLVPFGGFKESGIGRELGIEGLHQYLEPHTIGIPPELVPPTKGAA